MAEKIIYTIRSCVITHTEVRLDVFVSALVPFLPFDISRSQIKKMVVSIEANHKAVKISYRPSYKDELYISLEVPQSRMSRRDAAFFNTPEYESMLEIRHKEKYKMLSILYENEHFMAIDKPQGMVVHPGAGHQEDTLSQIVFHRLISYRNEEALLHRAGIVHRLDKDTSGVILIAKTVRMHDKLSRLFFQRVVQKKYIAIVKTQPRNNRGEVSGYIARHQTQRKKFTVVASESKGKDAHTSFRVLFSNGAYSVILCEPHTGRTHQIRVHMQHLGCPVVGDTMYSRDTIRYKDLTFQQDMPQLNTQLNTKHSTNNETLSNDDICPLMLHAYEIQFSLTVYDETKEYCIKADIPSHLQRALDILDIKDDIFKYV